VSYLIYLTLDLISSLVASQTNQLTQLTYLCFINMAHRRVISCYWISLLSLVKTFLVSQKDLKFKPKYKILYVD